MTRNVRQILLLLSTAGMAVPAHAVSQTVTVKASVVKPLTLTAVQGLDLGTFTLQPGTWSNAVVGISKLARVVEIFARRLQTQETMTAQIAQTIDSALEPRGSAVMIEAVHQCMSLRGVNKRNVVTITTQFTGEFKSNPVMQARFMELCRSPSGGFSL